MDIYLKITNTSTAVISWPWVTGLLTEEEKREYEEFRKTDEFLGLTEVDKQAKKKIPEAVKARVFYERRGKGVLFEQYYSTNGATRIERELKFCIGPNTDLFQEDPMGIYKALEKYVNNINCHFQLQ